MNDTALGGDYEGAKAITARPPEAVDNAIHEILRARMLYLAELKASDQPLNGDESAAFG